MGETVVCANIGPKARRKRVRSGWIGAVNAVVLGGGLVLLGAPLLTRLVVFLPLAVGAYGFFQARANTCVALAAQGQVDLDDGQRAIDEAMRAQIAAQARRVHLQSLAVAVLGTAALFLLPA